MDGFLTEADDADQRRAADGELLDFPKKVGGWDDRQRAIDATQVGQSVRRDIKAGRRTAGRRPPRNVDRRVGQLATAQASCFWGTEADSQPRSSSKQQTSSSDDGGGGGRGWRLAVGSAGGGARKQAALWPEWSVAQWLGRKVAKSLLSLP